MFGALCTVVVDVAKNSDENYYIFFIFKPKLASISPFIGMCSLLFIVINYIYMLFTGWEVRIVKNCDRGLENAARGRRPRAAFSRPRSQFFTIRTDPKPVNNLFIFF